MDYQSLLEKNKNISGKELTDIICEFLEQELNLLPEKRLRVPMYFNILVQSINNGIYKYAKKNKESSLRDNVIEALRSDFNLLLLDKVKSCTKIYE